MLKKEGRPSRPSAFTTRWPLPSGDDGDDLERAGLDDDDLVVDDEIEEATPRRMHFHDRGGHRHQMHRARHHDADADIEVHIRHPVHVAAFEDGLTDARALLGIEGRRAGARGAGALTLARPGLAVLALTGARLALIAVLG